MHQTTYKLEIISELVPPLVVVEDICLVEAVFYVTSYWKDTHDDVDGIHQTHSKYHN